MSRQVSVFIVYQHFVQLQEHILPVLEKQFKHSILNGKHTAVGTVIVSVFDVHVAEDYVLNSAKAHICDALPNVHVHIVEPQLGTWWIRHRSQIFIAVVTGIGGLLLSQVIEPFMAWMRNIFQ